MIANARMYAVTPAVEAAWERLLGHVFADADIALDYRAHPAPAPMDALWARDDLGAVMMCGYPIALGMGDIVPLAAPIPDVAWAARQPMYQTDLVVRADSPFATLADTFGGRLGWTTAHSHSGYNALRHHLLAYRTPDRPRLYARSIGDLVTPRAVAEAVLSGRIDVGPLDAYWHALATKDQPELMARLRIVDTTELAPMPAFVASAALPIAQVHALRAAFAAAADRPWFSASGAALRLSGFVPVDRASYATTLAWENDACAQGYSIPA